MPPGPLLPRALCTGPQARPSGGGWAWASLATQPAAPARLEGYNLFIYCLACVLWGRWWPSQSHPGQSRACMSPPPRGLCVSAGTRVPSECGEAGEGCASQQKAGRNVTHGCSAAAGQLWGSRRPAPCPAIPRSSLRRTSAHPATGPHASALPPLQPVRVPSGGCRAASAQMLF